MLVVGGNQTILQYSKKLITRRSVVIQNTCVPDGKIYGMDLLTFRQGGELLSNLRVGNTL